MKIVLFCGDKYNKPIQILAQRIAGEKMGFIMRSKKRHDLLQERKLHSHIINDVLQEHPDISKIIVCIDSECTPEEKTLKELKRLENSIKKKIEKTIHCLCVTHALEGWLLGDTETIKKYLGSPAGVNIPSSATSECKPKEVIRSIFQKTGRDFLPFLDSERIAKQINIEEVTKNNRSFARFRERIKDP